MVIALLELIGLKIPLKYLVLDGHFGNNNSLCMARQAGLNVKDKSLQLGQHEIG